MTTFSSRTAFEIARGTKVLVNLEVTLVLPSASEQPEAQPSNSPISPAAQQVNQTKELQERLSKEEEGLARAREQLADKDLEIARLRKTLDAGGNGARSEGVKPENMVWIFGTGRSGSTWLRSMMSEMKRHRVWEEPMVGRLFGKFYDEAQAGQLKSKNFIMGEPVREGWIDSIRTFILNATKYAHPDLTPDNLLVVKEPNGSMGAPLIMEALPESRMALLVRDPRDVVASTLDAARKGSWLYERKSKGDWKNEAMADTKPHIIVERRIEQYLNHVGRAKEAYEAHKGPKALVRYEDLREDPQGAMRQLYRSLEITVDEEELSRAVQKHSWENIPEDEKGDGKFYRKATPGGWKEDLTDEQVAIVEEATSPLLKEFYPE